MSTNWEFLRFNKIEQELGKKVPGALRKLSGGKWEWKPKTGDRVVTQNVVWKKPKEWFLQIVITIASYDFDTTLELISNRSRVWKSIKECYPIFHWEELEEILNKFGWVLYDMTRTVPSKEDSFWRAELAKGKQLKAGLGKTRQEAVQRAILALMEEKK